MTPPPTGPPTASRFSSVLRTAIQTSGLSLNRIQHRLHEQGVTVSSATLSYWQSGRSQPSRRESLLVVRALEDVLRVPPGTLEVLLEPPGSRQRQRGGRRPAGAPLETLWADPGTARAVQEHLGTDGNAGLSRLSAHDRYEVGPDRRVHRVWHRQVLRADRDGPDRWVLICEENSPDDPLPEVRAVWRCRLGAVVVERQPRLLVAHLLFGRPLTRGETYVMEYELGYSGPGALARERYERKFTLPVREHVVEILFDPAAVPVRCERYSVLAEAPVREQILPLRIESGYVHVAMTDAGPGRHGIRWYWA